MRWRFKKFLLLFNGQECDFLNSLLAKKAIEKRQFEENTKITGDHRQNKRFSVLHSDAMIDTT